MKQEYDTIILCNKEHKERLRLFSVGDTIRWKCDDDGKAHNSKIISITVEIDNNREPDIEYVTKILFKGIMQTAYVKPKWIITRVRL